MRPLHTLSLWLALALLIVEVLFFARFELIDDAFISIRYADNLLAGKGLVFNPGEVVEGYTNFLWVLLLAIAKFIGVAYEVSARWLGALALLATALVLPRFRTRCQASTPMAPVFLALGVVPAFWAVHGLESAVFGLWILLAVVADTAPDGSGFRRVPAPIWWGLAALTRPEGWLLFAARSLFLLVADPDRRTHWKRWKPSLWFLTLAGGHLAFRWIYYGALLPNTFHAKVSSTPRLPLRGLFYVADFVGWLGIPWILILLVGYLHHRRDSAIALVYWLTSCGTAIVILEGGDGFFGHRFMAPLLPLLAILTAVSVEPIQRFLQKRRNGTLRWIPRSARWGGVLVTVAAALQALGVFPEVLRQANQDDLFTHDMKVSGRALKEHFPADTVISLNPIGALPWTSGFFTVDQLGLIDPVVARTPAPHLGSGAAGHERGNGSYVLDRRPDIVMIGNVFILDAAPTDVRSIEWPLTLKSEIELAADPRVTQEYFPACVPMEDERSLCFLGRRDFLTRLRR